MPGFPRPARTPEWHREVEAEPRERNIGESEQVSYVSGVEALILIVHYF